MGEMSTPGSQNSSGAFDLTQFYQVFFEEAGENLASMENLLLSVDLEDPIEEDLHAIFRAAHSIKGGAATFGFQDVTELTHELETLLDRVRKHELALSKSMVDTLLDAGDVLKAQLARHQAGDNGESEDATELIATVRKLAKGEVTDSGKPADGTRSLHMLIGPLADLSVIDNIIELFADIPGLGTINALEGEAGAPGEGLRAFLVVTPSPDEELRDLFSFHVSRDQVQFTAASSAAPGTHAQDMGGDRAAMDNHSSDPGYGFFVDPATLPLARDKGAEPEPAKAKAAVVAAKPRVDRRAPAEPDASTLRVAVEKIDQLINLVGELVITQSMLSTKGRELDPIANQGMLSGLADLERSTRSLQDAVMGIRMIPMAVVFNRFPRMLRDLAAKLGKEVDLKTSGEATELDKGLIEKITDPLTHLVRNSVDHGIESPAKRIAAGKSGQGTITLSASHQGGSIVIEVRDDGAGLNRDRILEKAREKGIPVPDGITDQEVWQLIFAPGFSTAEVVTEVSGRGVGMDVVKKNITALGGTVELDSAEGYGTRVSVRLPLTLAIMDGMSVGVGEEIYIIPIGSVIESFQVSDSKMKTISGNQRVVEVRKEYLPVVALDELFQVPRFDWEKVSGTTVIVEAEGARVALLVDELVGQHQVVVKNLEANYRKVAGVSGATILGDGRVALILDVSALVKRGRH
jgi:two-component system chemotaxis sensor kinase CheA